MRLLVAGLEQVDVDRLFAPIRARFRPEGVLPDWQNLDTAVEHFQPDTIVLYLDVRPGQALAMARQVLSLHPAVRIIALAQHDEPELISAVDRSGCADLVLLSEGAPALLASLERVSTQEAPPEANGSVVTVLGGKGGVGATTIAVNLAAEVAARGQPRVILVDLHLFLGDAALALDIVPDPDVLHYLSHGPKLTAASWAEGPPMHRAGFRVLGLAGDLRSADPVTAQQVVYLLDRLRERHDHVIVDCGSDINEVSMAALTVSDRRLLVLQDEFRGLLGARRRVEALRSIGLPDPIAHVVLNRDDPDAPADRGAIEDSAGAPVAAAVTNAWREVHAALQQGRVLREGWPKAKVTRDLRALAGFVAGTESREERRRKAFFSLFSRD